MRATATLSGLSEVSPRSGLTAGEEEPLQVTLHESMVGSLSIRRYSDIASHVERMVILIDEIQVYTAKVST